MTETTTDATSIGADNTEPDFELDATDWRTDAGVAGDPNFEKFENVGSLAKSYGELQKAYSKAARFPTEDASDERRAEFRDKVLAADDRLMVKPDDFAAPPPDPSGYEFEKVEGANIDAETQGAFKALAHELGLNTNQANGLHQWLGGNIASEQGEAATANTNGMAELKGQWGQATEAKMQAAQNTVALLEDRVPGLGTMLDGLAAKGQDAIGIRLMDAVTEMMGEAGAVPSTHRSQLTPEEASQQLLELREKFSHLDEGSPGWSQYRTKELQLRKAGGRITDFGGMDGY